MEQGLGRRKRLPDPFLSRGVQAGRLCGNIDPAGLFAQGTPEMMREATESLLRDCGARENFLLSSGCDIPPKAKWENIEAFFEAAGIHGNGL